MYTLKMAEVFPRKPFLEQLTYRTFELFQKPKQIERTNVAKFGPYNESILISNVKLRSKKTGESSLKATDYSGPVLVVAFGRQHLQKRFFTAQHTRYL